MGGVVNVSFADKDFNMADSGTKSRGDYRLAHEFYRSGFFTVGFLGRAEIERLKNQSMGKIGKLDDQKNTNKEKGRKRGKA